MANKAAIECADELCQSITKIDKPFGAIPTIALGDFRQNTPVIRGHCGVTAVHSASIKSSPLWKNFNIRSLHQPIRGAQDLDYVAFVDQVGEDFQNSKVSLGRIERVLSIEDAINFLYPQQVLETPELCIHRAFLSPLNAYVDEFNTRILDKLPGIEGLLSTTRFMIKSTNNNLQLSRILL
jgi:PIF1-like helicase